MCTANNRSVALRRPQPAAAASPQPRQFDPDLRPYYAPPENLRLSPANKAMLPAVVMMTSRNQKVLAEQERRDTLRAGYAEAEQAANEQLAKIGEQQKAAEEARAAEARRQAQLQQGIDRARVQQQEAIDQERAATDAMTMAAMTPGTAAGGSAPTAQVNRNRRGRGRVRSTAGAQGLRIDGSRQSPGVGLNIGA